MNAVDTNIYVYALDADAPSKQAIAHALFNRLTSSGESTITLWQVAVELLANLRRRESAGSISSDDLKAHFDDFLSMFPLVCPNESALAAYFELKQ